MSTAKEESGLADPEWAQSRMWAWSQGLRLSRRVRYIFIVMSLGLLYTWASMAPTDSKVPTFVQQEPETQQASIQHQNIPHPDIQHTNILQPDVQQQDTYEQDIPVPPQKYTQNITVINEDDYQGEYTPFSFSGFVNHGRPGKVACDDLRFSSDVEIQRSFFLQDDMVEIAKSLQDHPMINYEGQNKNLTFEEMVEKTWLRMAQSSAWLEKYQVYLVVTRVMFYDKGVTHWPVISFLRGQIYDHNWVEQKNFVVEWQGEQTVFPCIFDVQTPYEKGGGFYGPEDPRIIVEPGVEDAEPVIIFNMVNDVKKQSRAMHIFRPFSNDTTILTIKGQFERPDVEKNWMPFFYDQGKQMKSPSTGRWPSQYLHFIHSWNSLRIIRCHLLSGYCDKVYTQPTLEDPELESEHGPRKGRMSGGSNFVPVDIKTRDGLRIYLGFGRTHDDSGCLDESLYRPEILILVATKKQYHLHYASDALDFDTWALSPAALADPCGEGRILIVNSISQWDQTNGKDVMSLTFMVDDRTTQVIRLQGLRKFVESLPYLQETVELDVEPEEEAWWNLRWSTVARDVLGCSVAASGNYSIRVAAPNHGVDLRKQREKEEEQQLKEEEEQQQKEEERQRKKEEQQRKEEERQQKEAEQQRKDQELQPNEET